MDLVLDSPRARRAAWRLLSADLGRWDHVVGVATEAAGISMGLPEFEADYLVAAAWLHDIGYAETVADTGMHQLDGARYLRSIGAAERLCRLVANHTCAWVEADVRGLGGALAGEFPRELSEVADALTYADLTTGPRGDPVSIDARLADIYDRYPPGHVVHESIRRAEPHLIATVRRVEARLAAAHPR